jgi:hypothetical protein
MRAQDDAGQRACDAGQGGDPAPNAIEVGVRGAFDDKHQTDRPGDGMAGDDFRNAAKARDDMVAVLYGVNVTAISARTDGMPACVDSRTV